MATQRATCCHRAPNEPANSRQFDRSPLASIYVLVAGSRPRYCWISMRRAPRVLVQLAAAVLPVAVLADALAASSSAPAPSEYQVKAEFIERFTRFVDWPSSAFASPGAAFVVCVRGGGALAEQLELVVARRRIKDRPVRVLHLGSGDRLTPCHLLYVAEVDHKAVREITAITRGKAILSVGDQPGFAEDGLLINLILDDKGFVRFEINRDEASASGLKISAKLMRLARLVGSRR